MPRQRLRFILRSETPPERKLLVRVVLLLSLFATVMAVFWFDRDGLKDQIDGHISFPDVVYFTAVTVTTVGYGDIVPVSDRARLIDAVLVTPLRLVIWLIFMGTAYELVLQRWLEERKMRKAQEKLSDHLIICGFGDAGQSAAQEAVARGMSPDRILVIDRDASGVELAANHGHLCLQADVTRESVLTSVGLERAQAIMLCLGRDDTTVLTTLTIRQLNDKVRIVCAIRENENVKLVEQAGANATITPSLIGGYLMTNSVKSSYVAEYISDLMLAGGKVQLMERAPKPQELGVSLRDIRPSMAVCLIRGQQRVGFWEGEATVVRQGDVLLVIDAVDPQTLGAKG